MRLNRKDCIICRGGSEVKTCQNSQNELSLQTPVCQSWVACMAYNIIVLFGLTISMVDKNFIICILYIILYALLLYYAIVALIIRFMFVCYVHYVLYRIVCDIDLFLRFAHEVYVDCACLAFPRITFTCPCVASPLSSCIIAI